MIIYKPFEMHTHTFHSDGNFSLEELCQNAADYGLEGIALTDHNTMSAFDGLSGTPVINGVSVIRGIEWTTFFGHMQVLYPEAFVDWRKAKPETIDRFTEQIHAADGIVGIVHPFEMGSPMCTGCYFDFKVQNWDAIDYIEVWSKKFPTQRYETPYALAMWTDLLNRGHRIAITAGRDWHREGASREHAAATYIGLRDGIVSADTVREAFRNGRTYLTCGPSLDIDLVQHGEHFTMGDVVRQGVPCTLSVVIDREARRFAWEEFGIIPCELRLTANGKTEKSVSCCEGERFEFGFEPENGWFRLEMWGDALGEPDKMIGLSGAFYCEA